LGVKRDRRRKSDSRSGVALYAKLKSPWGGEKGKKKNLRRKGSCKGRGSDLAQKKENRLWGKKKESLTFISRIPSSPLGPLKKKG